jgi:hypothetical protein
MSRRFCVKKFTNKDFSLKIRFETDQLEEGQGTLSIELHDEVLKCLNEVSPTVKDKLPESAVEEIYTAVEHILHTDETNRYENMMGDKHQRVRLVSVELFDEAGNSVMIGD